MEAQHKNGLKSDLMVLVFWLEISYLSCFLFTDSILRVEVLRVIVWGKLLPLVNCPDDISLRRGIFSWRRNQISWRYWKNLKRKEIIMYSRRLPPPQFLALFAKLSHFFFVSIILSQFFKKDSWNTRVV